MNDPYIVTRDIFESTSLVDHNGVFHKNIKTREAINMAKQNGLDLVCFKKDGKESFCKIINYGKWKYSDEKRKKKQKQHAFKSVTKEIQFSPDIADNDINHKIRQVLDFLDRGDEVILRMSLFGRQRLHSKEAEEKLNYIAGLCKDHGEEVKREKSDNQIVIRMKKKNKEKENI